MSLAIAVGYNIENNKFTVNATEINNDNVVEDFQIVTQTFKIREVDGTEAIALERFGDPTGKIITSSTGLQADIIKFVDCGKNDVSSIILSFSKGGALIGANIEYVPSGTNSGEQIAFIISSFTLSNSQDLMMRISDFVAEPLRQILDIQYIKDSSGNVIVATILYENEKLS